MFDYEFTQTEEARQEFAIAYGVALELVEWCDLCAMWTFEHPNTGYDICYCD